MLIIVFVWCMYATMDLKATNKALRSNNTSAKTNTDRVLRRRTTSNKTGFMSNKRLCRPTLPEMLDELVLEILVRLPVKSLLRFKSVCKTWYATISGQSFISMHLQRSVSNHQRQLSFLVTPHLLDSISDDVWPTTFSNNICFYRWQKGQASASLVFTRDFQGDFGSVYKFGDCNGLVLVPTDNKMYVLNPATKELLTLPESPRSMLLPSSLRRATVGFGLDPRTNKYKVVRCFKHSSDGAPRACSMGMEVFTIDDNSSAASWRDTVADPPYPISAWQTATYFQGSLFWMVNKLNIIQSLESRLLRFCLQDEIFSFTVHPPCPALDHERFMLSELDGELCLAQFDSSLRIAIWMTHDGVNPQWDRRYILNVQPSLTIAISHHGVLLKKVHHIFQYDFQSQSTEDVAHLDVLRYHGPGTHIIDYACQNLFFVHVIPYIESLVPIANAR